MSADVRESHDRVTGPYCRTCGSDSVGCSDCHEAEIAGLRATLAQVTAERDAAREAFDNLSTLQQADRKESMDARHALATLRADLAAQVERMPGLWVVSRDEVLTLLRGPHAD